jgi:hypothetical protein
LQYIISFNCGICPSTTTNTMVVCTEIQLEVRNCTFSIQTSVCDSLIGDAIQIPLMLKSKHMVYSNLSIHRCYPYTYIYYSPQCTNYSRYSTVFPLIKSTFFTTS